jgi:hypothetical protein
MASFGHTITIGSLGAANRLIHGRPSINWASLPARVRKPACRRHQRVLLLNPAATLYEHDYPRCWMTRLSMRLWDR